MNDALWKTPDDVLWALKEASQAGGAMPHAASTASFLGLLEGRGYLIRSAVAPAWHISDSGRAILSGDKSLTKDDHTAIETLRSAF